MVIYGVALLAACMLLGIQMGSWLGTALGIEANVGGVGLAMLMLIVLSNLSKQRFQLSPVSESGIKFWSAMYIPIVVAMAAKQNVAAALDGGLVALVAGILAVSASFLLVPVLARFDKETALEDAENSLPKQ
jgi:malonate transporter MadL subunit